MVVMFNVTDPVEREHAMANRKATPARLDWKAVLTSDADGFRALLQTVVQDVLEAEISAAVAEIEGFVAGAVVGYDDGDGAAQPLAAAAPVALAAAIAGDAMAHAVNPAELLDVDMGSVRLALSS